MRDKDNPREGPSSETLAYIAGIIDGEGTIKKSSHDVRVCTSA